MSGSKQPSEFMSRITSDAQHSPVPVATSSDDIVMSNRKSDEVEDDDDDAKSETSTICYEHEPFETFRYKVADLVAEKFKCAITDVVTEHIKGGTFNRVVGVDIRAAKPIRHCFGWVQKLMRTLLGKPAPTAAGAHVVRVARGDTDELEKQIAVLKAVDARVALPTPHVVHYDLSAHNVLEKPYMVQKRIDGRPISHMLEHLNLEQKKCIATRFIQLTNQLASVEAAPGRISIENLTSSVDEPVRVTKICDVDEDDVLATPQKSIDHLLEVCQMWRDAQTASGFCFETIWDGFSVICKSLEARGFLKGPCVLVHGDLREYNLLAAITSPSTVDITGIIDWDDSCFAPKFMAFRSPFWLWMTEDSDASCGDDEHEKNAHLNPASDNDRAVQRVFLENASDEYKRFAFAPEAFLARRMYGILRSGLYDEWTMSEAEAVIREWAELHPEDDIHIGESYM
ncbi:hypothetical protein BDU57DRAFT_522347 [Ampelomyces quisqualis]|uniref:Aminoglycoside phosphotransferase domain-containing protein n=1 Tax=Ampelomyces quisqualis TaxID=50730 RepID=A0A6A5QD94_AMPQU|nr:hypothetical protein BDU57DRAFT_522347 [Ampelomyces quisqualis]